MQWFKSTMQWFNIAKLAIFKVALLHQYTELKNSFNKKPSISSIVKVPFSKNIYDTAQCLSNPGFRSIKVQNVDFLKKPSVDNIFFSLSPNMLSSFKSKIWNVYCPVHILEVLTSVSTFFQKSGCRLNAPQGFVYSEL